MNDLPPLIFAVDYVHRRAAAWPLVLRFWAVPSVGSNVRIPLPDGRGAICRVAEITLYAYRLEPLRPEYAGEITLDQGPDAAEGGAS